MWLKNIFLFVVISYTPAAHSQRLQKKNNHYSLITISSVLEGKTDAKTEVVQFVNAISQYLISFVCSVTIIQCKV